MRSIALVFCLLIGMATAAIGQATPNSGHSGDLALAFQSVHTNAPPGGGCGCFYLTGAGLSGSWNYNSRLAWVAEVSVDHTSKALASAQSLTLTSFMAGARYQVLRPHSDGSHSLQPFAQLLVGGAHAGGGLAGVGDGTPAFAGRMGGGVDVPLTTTISARVVADYYLTDFGNTLNNHQNNLLFGAGIVLHWAR